MLSRSIPNCTQDDVRTYGGKISETYQYLEGLLKDGRVLTPDQYYILALTRMMANMQRELKQLLDTLESRHGLR